MYLGATFLLKLVIFSLCLKALFLPCYRSTDFEVHRNWMAITSSLPYSKWYFEATSMWTLDYPPMFAHFERLLSHPAHLFDPNMLKLTSLNYASEGTVLFMRLSVSFTDILLIVTTFLWAREYAEGASMLFLVVCNAGLLLVDHVHFQYNGALLGLLVACLLAAQQRRVYALAALFTVLVLMKHLFAPLAPLVALVLWRHCTEREGEEGKGRGALTLRSVGKMMGVLLVILLIVCLAFAPILLDSADPVAQLQQIGGRLFPFGRGLVHAYWAPNAWALYYFLDKALAFLLRKLLCWEGAAGSVANSASGLVGDFALHLLPRVSPLHCLLLLLLSALVACAAYWRRSDARGLVKSMGFLSFSCFLFGYHVHEKAVLIPLLLYSLLPAATERERVFLHAFNSVAVVSLFPLILGKLEWVVKVVGSVAYLTCAWQALRCSRLPLPSQRLLHLLHLALLEAVAYADALHPLLFAEREGGGVAFPFLPLMCLSVVCALVLCALWGAALVSLFREQ